VLGQSFDCYSFLCLSELAAENIYVIMIHWKPQAGWLRHDKKLVEVNIPRQSRGLYWCEPLKAAEGGR
jgi:hypothetical protein